MSNPVGRLIAAFAVLILLAGDTARAQAAAYQQNCRLFSETGKTVCGRFLAYWDSHGGLPQQGYPISGELREVSETDGKQYTVQYFERAVFELHPENAAPYDVLLSLLGGFEYSRRYGSAGAPGQKASTTNPRTFSETGKTVGGRFRDYWERNGGLAQQGYPISEEFQERSELNGQTYTVQYFERAVFEFHTANRPPFDVLLSQLGTFTYNRRHAAPPTPTAQTPSPSDPWSSLRARPLQLPSTAGRPCPRTPGKVVSPDFGPALGAGPFYPVGLGTDGVARYQGALEEGGWYLQKVLWVAEPSYSGPVLVRGARIDAPGELRFERTVDPPRELLLHTDQAQDSSSGWHHWPSYTRFRGAGCYAYQVDGPAFTSVIVFEARDESP